MILIYMRTHIHTELYVYSLYPYACIGRSNSVKLYLPTVKLTHKFEYHIKIMKNNTIERQYSLQHITNIHILTYSHKYVQIYRFLQKFLQRLLHIY